MSDPIQQTPRTKAEINQEYTQRAMEAGDLQFRILLHQKKLECMYALMFVLEEEGIKVDKLKAEDEKAFEAERLSLAPTWGGPPMGDSQ